MTRTVSTPDAWDQRAQPFPYRAFLKILRVSIYKYNSSKTKYQVYSKAHETQQHAPQEHSQVPSLSWNGSSWLTLDLHDWNYSTAGDIGLTFPQTESSHSLSDTWERTKSSQSCAWPWGRHHHLWWTTGNQDMATEDGMGNTKALFSPLRNYSHITPSDNRLQLSAKEVL